MRFPPLRGSLGVGLPVAVAVAALLLSCGNGTPPPVTESVGQQIETYLDSVGLSGRETTSSSGLVYLIREPGGAEKPSSKPAHRHLDRRGDGVRFVAPRSRPSPDGAAERDATLDGGGSLGATRQPASTFSAGRCE